MGDDYEAMSFNTAISAMMILVNELNSQHLRSRAAIRTLTQLLAPLAPHIAEELWSRLGGQGFVALAPWPGFDPSLVQDDVVHMGVQVNGKTRGDIELSLTASEEDAVALARAQNAVKNALDGKIITKVIYKPGKILNIIVK